MNLTGKSLLGLGALFLALFLFYPIWGVFTRTFYFNNQWSFGLFFQAVTGPASVTALANSLLLGVAAVILTSLIALPLAVLQSSFEFPLKRLCGGIILVPLIVPPFVGAIGIQRMLGRFGLLNGLLGTTPFDWLSESGFWGVAFLQALHLFPVMVLNLSAALANIDPSLNEAARVAGASPRRVFRDITLPLALPGFAAGAILVFLWSVTDVGTPLVMGYRNTLAVEIFDRTAAINNDPTGPALVTLMVLMTVFFMLLYKFLVPEDRSLGGSKGSRGYEPVRIRGWRLIPVYAAFGGVLLLALLPHLGLILTSLAQTWFMTPLPTEYSTKFFASALSNDGIALSVRNSLFYSGLSTIIDIAVGFGLAWLLVRKKVRAAFLLDAAVMLPLALPGLVLAFGYVAAFSGTFLDPLNNPVPLLVIGYAVRRLPFTFRAAHAGLQQIGPEYEEAARVCGASPLKAALSITLPLCAASVIAGGLLAFLFAMLEVSESLILAVKEQFYPLTREIYYLLGKLPDGDYLASALGVLCMAGLAIGLTAASMLMGRHMGRLFRM